MTPPGRSGRLLVGLVVLGLCAAGMGCKKAGDGQRSLLELRPVLGSTPPPCPAKAAKAGEVVRPRPADGTVAECLELGRPIVDAGDVRSATVAQTPAGEPALSVVLGSVGSANLDRYAQRNQGKRLAIVADGQLVSAPVLQFTSFAGRVQVTGLSKEKTEDLFRRLNTLIRSG
jgi:preprotein translocase subunit SecD